MSLQMQEKSDHSSSLFNAYTLFTTTWLSAFAASLFRFAPILNHYYRTVLIRNYSNNSSRLTYTVPDL